MNRAPPTPPPTSSTRPAAVALPTVHLGHGARARQRSNFESKRLYVGLVGAATRHRPIADWQGVRQSPWPSTSYRQAEPMSQRQPRCGGGGGRGPPVVVGGPALGGVGGAVAGVGHPAPHRSPRP